MKLHYNYKIMKKVALLLLFTYQLTVQKSDSIQNKKIVNRSSY